MGSLPRLFLTVADKSETCLSPVPHQRHMGDIGVLGSGILSKVLFLAWRQHPSFSLRGSSHHSLALRAFADKPYPLPLHHSPPPFRFSARLGHRSLVHASSDQKTGSTSNSRKMRHAFVTEDGLLYFDFPNFIPFTAGMFRCFKKRQNYFLFEACKKVLY